MVNRQAGVLRQFHQLFSLGAVGGTTDAQLLARFLDRQDAGGEVAFEVLVERHGPMVLRVCRGVLRDEHAAEDAFQATFLVLARKARSIWVKDSLGSWLHGVAQRVASRARSDAMRRRRHERQAAEQAGTAGVAEAFSDGFQSDTEAVLGEEIARLPEKYRAPIVLCYLEAMSYQEAASRLGLTEDALRGRLARARERLRSRLTRRGVEVSGILVASRPAIRATLAVRSGLLQSTARAAMSVSAGSMVGSGLISETAISLSERICRTMIRTKLSAAAMTLALGTLVAGAMVLAQSGGGRRDQPERPAKTPHLVAVAPRSEGNLIVDWIPVKVGAEKVEITVDAVRHCVHLAEMSVKRDSRPNDGAVRLDLERGKTYTVAAAGEAFMTSHTGPDADPFPGVVLIYATDEEEDGYAIRQTVLAPGKSITFRMPWALYPEDEVFLIAFFLDLWPQTQKRGSYTLSVTQDSKPQAFKKHTILAPFDGIIVKPGGKPQALEALPSTLKIENRAGP
jgi:RNA polymerase sigma factor (sigma-70 family)